MGRDRGCLTRFILELSRQVGDRRKLPALMRFNIMSAGFLVRGAKVASENFVTSPYEDSNFGLAWSSHVCGLRKSW